MSRIWEATAKHPTQALTLAIMAVCGAIGIGGLLL